jgi:hypothetical protein
VTAHGGCWLRVTQQMAGNHPETLPDAPGRIVNLAKISAVL